MRSTLLCLTLLSLFIVAEPGRPQRNRDQYGDNIAATKPLSPADEKKCFRLPPGFDVELVAADPDIHKPMNLAFDDHGRLWVTDTVEYPKPVDRGKKGRDTVKVLSDFGPDGRARKITTFADDLNIPIGVMPLEREALVFSIPNILRLRDTTGAGKADKRHVLYEKYGFVDTHGMTSAFTWGLDGWIYACHGYRNTSTIKAADGSQVTMESGNIYRLRADGSRIEQFTWGQVNPFGICFDPLGNLYSADCHTQPIYQLLRGAYYPSFGKPHDGLDFGPEMITNYKGSTAISGVAYYAADHFPAAYRDTAFVGDVITNQVVQFRLTWNGSTPKASQHDFLVSTDPWFRPVDIKLGPDGALYVADFYNCIIGHYEVPLNHPKRDRERGRIWRIVYRGPDGKGKPHSPRTDWTKAIVTELVRDLGHANQWVRTTATNQLVARGADKVVDPVAAVVKLSASPWQRAHGLWVLERLGKLDDDTLTRAAGDEHAAVRVHAQRILSERKRLGDGHRKLALSALKDTDAQVRRAAADALGRHPASGNLPPLLALRHRVPDPDSHLRHVVRMALRDQLRSDAVWKEADVSQLKDRDADAVADVCVGLPTVRAASFLFAHISARKDPGPALPECVRHVARYGDAGTTKKLDRFVKGGDDMGRHATLLRALFHGTQERGGRLGDDTLTWAVALTGKLIASTNAAHVKAGVDLVGDLRLPSMEPALLKVAADRKVTEGQRSGAFSALAALDGKKHTALIGKALVDLAEPAGLRQHCARVLAGLNHDEARAQLLQALQTAPAGLQTIIGIGLAGSRQGAVKLLEAVAAGKASARLLQERGVAVRLTPHNVAGMRERVKKLTADLPSADEKIQALMKKRRDGFLKAKADVALGQKLFEKHCALCHQVGGKGARIGPQLDGIGLRGLDRLLEDTLDPNRNVDQAFRLTTLQLKNGRYVSGLLLREDGGVYVVVDSEAKEIRVPIKDVDEKSTSQASAMPANFADMPEADFHHLMAYLLGQKPSAR